MYMKREAFQVTIMILLIILICFALVPTSYAQSRIDIPLVGKEALPVDVNGMARSKSPVKVGVPLLDSYMVTDINQLGVTNTDAYQFRVLQRYPSGNIRWVLVDFQADLPANGMAEVKLVPGTGNTGGPDLAQVENDVISINTGPAMFRIVRNTGILLHEAVVNNDDLLEIGQGASLEASDADGIFYDSSYDPSPNTILEENGPVRATIKQTGFLFDQSGTKRFFGYTVRLHFYKGHKYIRALVTFKNDLLENNQIRVFETRGCALRLQTTLQQNTVYRFGVTSGIYEGQINDEAYLVQGYSDFRRFDESAELEDRLTEGRGTLVRNGSTILQNYTAASDYALGWASMRSNTNKTINFAFRAMSGYWAGGFHLKGDGTARIQVLSDKAKPSGFDAYMFSYYAHETREFLIDFGGEFLPEILEKELTYPLWGIPPYKLLAETGAFLEETRLVGFKDQKDFFKNHLNQNWSLSNTDETRAGHWIAGPIKMWSWAGAGIKGGVPWPLISLIDAYRSGYGGLFLFSHYWSYYTGDLAVLHVSEYGTSPQNIGSGPTFNGLLSGYKKYIEWEHPHWLHLIPYYFLTGDEKIREDIIAVVALRWAQSNLETGDRWPYFRVTAYAMRLFAIAATLDILPDYERDRNRAALDTFLNNFLYIHEDGSVKKQGWNNERGFLHENYEERTLSFLRLNEIGAICLNELYLRFRDLFPDDNVRYHKLRDRLLGLAYFNQYEDLQYPEDPGQVIFLPLDYFLVEHGNMGYQVLFLQAFGYEQTGDPAFLERGKYLIPHIMEYQNNWRLSERTAQRFIHTFINRDKINVSYPELTITNQGNGNYLLTWQVPGLPVHEYVLKYSDKEIVPNLNFDNQKRTFEYSPEKYVNFWASDEPAINPDKNVNSFRISGLDPDKSYYFKLKALHRLDIVSSIKEYEEAGQPKNFGLEILNYPNPFNPKTKIQIKVNESVRRNLTQSITLVIYNIHGQRVAYFSDLKSSEVIWDASKQATGVYIAQLNVGDIASKSIKMLLLQ